MPESTILLVEADPRVRQSIHSSVLSSGLHVHEVTSTAEAIALIQEKDPTHFQAILVEAGEFGMEGLQLMEWIQSIDSSLAVIIMAAEGEQAVLEVALRRGAADFLNKSIDSYALCEALTKACAKTIQTRRQRTAEKNIRAVARMNHLFRSIHVPELVPYLQLHHTPHEDVGGDFVNVIALPDGGSLLLVGDVSGHDLRAGFVSAYFQGLVRGLCHSGHSIIHVCTQFNNILLREWEHKNSKNPFRIEPRTSLSLLALQLHPQRAHATVVNCGAPPIRLAHLDGRLTKLESANMPLGWSSKEPIHGQVIQLDDIAMVYLATDGLHDWAERLGNSSMGLTYRLLEERSSPGGTPPDDLLVLRYQHAQQAPTAQLWHPLGGAARTADNTPLQMAERLETLLKVNLRHSPSAARLLSVLQAEGKDISLATLAVRPADMKVKMTLHYADGSHEGVRVLGLQGS